MMIQHTPIQDVCSSLGVSRQTLYKRLKKLQIKTVKEKGKSCLTADSMEKLGLKTEEKKPTTNGVDSKQERTSSGSEDSSQVLAVLAEQLKEKDEQIKSLQKSLAIEQKNLSQQQELSMLDKRALEKLSSKVQLLISQQEQPKEEILETQNNKEDIEEIEEVEATESPEPKVPSVDTTGAGVSNWASGILGGTLMLAVLGGLFVLNQMGMLG